MGREGHHRYQFGRFSIDTSERLLLCDDQVVPLKQKALDTLLVLLGASPHMVEKDAFMSEVWPDAFVEEGSLAANISQLRKILGGDFANPQYIQTIPRRGYRFVAEVKTFDLPSAAPPPINATATSTPATAQAALARTIAVLPFTNVNPDPALDYLSEGITDSIINRLSQLSNLRVRASSTILRFKGEQIEVQTVGRELDVSVVLLGRILQFGDKLIIRAQLVDATEGTQLWGEQYNRTPADLLAVQEEIAREISAKLSLRLTASERQRLTKRHTKNLDAYHAYLRGRYFWNRRPSGLNKAIEYFEQATELDVNFALAYVGLADCYGALGAWESGALPAHEAMPRARTAAERALSLDNELAEAYTSLGYIKMHYDWEWAEADEAFQRALDLNPNYANAHHWRSHYLMAVGSNAESLAASYRCIELDPLDLISNIHLAWHYHFAGEYDRALEQCQKTAELDEIGFWSAFFSGLAYEQKNMYEDALREFRKARSLSEATFAMTGYAHVCARVGRREDAIQILRELEQRSKKQYVAAYDRAIIYAGLEEREQAFEWLNKAFEERSSWMAYLKVEPRLHRLCSEPEFADLLRRIGLPR